MPFLLTDQPIRPTPSAHDRAGGYVTFEGKVRNHANGRDVLRLEYEAAPDLAVAEGERLLAEAAERFGLLSATVIHRVGTLEIGETAVWIETAAAHRREAFAGCEWIIDQLKHRVPIWKKEHYLEGDSGWVGADAVATSETLAEALTRRQRALAEVGEAGQARLRDARVLLVGVGGLGSACLPYLTGAGIGTIGLLDADTVDTTNLHRQVIYAADDAGRLKVDRAAAFVQRLNPTVHTETHPERLDPANVDRLVSSYDWIVDGTDSLAAKFLLNAACRRHGKTLVTASIHRFEGHLMTIAPDGPCLRCLFPEAPADGCVATCEQVGVLGVVPALFGVLQANEVLMGLLGYGEPHTNSMLLVDLRTGASSELARTRRPGCPVCEGREEDADPLEMGSLREAHERLGEFRLVDIREWHEEPALTVLHERIPMSEFTLPCGERPLLLVCAHGVRSYHLASLLRSKQVEAYSLRGGLEAPDLW